MILEHLPSVQLKAMSTTKLHDKYVKTACLLCQGSLDAITRVGHFLKSRDPPWLSGAVLIIIVDLTFRGHPSLAI